MVEETLYQHEEFIVKWLYDGRWYNYTNYLSSYSLALMHEKRHNELWPNLKTRIVRKTITEEVM